MNAYLMAAAVAFSPPAAADQAPAPTHEVRAGESLSGIARCELGDGDRWTELVELNGDRIADPDLIEAGWVLLLPEEGSGDCPERPRAQAAAVAPTRRSSRATRKVAPAAVQPSRRRGRDGGSLAAIRDCESGGNYAAVSANGTYRGAYQFDRQTWAAVGGSGDPAAASPEEQDQRAAALHRRRGGSPWPSCS